MKLYDISSLYVYRYRNQKLRHILWEVKKVDVVYLKNGPTNSHDGSFNETRCYCCFTSLNFDSFLERYFELEDLLKKILPYAEFEVNQSFTSVQPDNQIDVHSSNLICQSLNGASYELPRRTPYN